MRRKAGTGVQIPQGAIIEWLKAYYSK